MNYKLNPINSHHNFNDCPNMPINSTNMDEFDEVCQSFFDSINDIENHISILSYLLNIKEFPVDMKGRLNYMLSFVYNIQYSEILPLTISVLHLFVLKLKLNDPTLYDYIYSELRSLQLIPALFSFQYPPVDGINYYDIHISIFINCMLFNKGMANEIFATVFPIAFSYFDFMDSARVLKFIMVAPLIPYYLSYIKKYLDKCKDDENVSLKNYLEANLNLIKKIPYDGNYISSNFTYYKYLINTSPEITELAIVFQTLSHICQNQPNLFNLDIDVKTFQNILHIVEINQNADVSKNALVFISIWIFKCLRDLPFDNRVFLYLNHAFIFQSLALIRENAPYYNQILISSILILFLASVPASWLTQSQFEKMGGPLAYSFFQCLQYDYGANHLNSGHLFHEQYLFTQLDEFFSDPKIKSKPDILKSVGFEIVDPGSSIDEGKECLQKLQINQIELSIYNDVIYVLYL